MYPSDTGPLIGTRGRQNEHFVSKQAAAATKVCLFKKFRAAQKL